MPKLKVGTATIAQLAQITLRKLDEHIQRNRPQKAFKSEREDEQLKLTDTKGNLVPKAVHYVTNGACHRPDLFFKGGRACDYCALYPHCMSKVKNLKDEDSQPPDEIAPMIALREREAEESRRAAALAARPKLRTSIAKKSDARPRQVIVIKKKVIKIHK